ncbi:MAG TPA: aldehyde ferredoxin oxidoreductase N-terminal domain-containing protein [Deltaproteobacteria bacterium]|nr:aldehyde ferredoxin oxidoreductase N-terminal domain-containing protein [Deltaproteobacteria bacterium]
MDTFQKVLLVDAATAFYRLDRFKVGDFFGPVDLGLHLAGMYNSLNIGTGLLAGSIFPGSNRLIFTGFSPCWGGFYISSMGGAGLVFDDLGINMLSLVGRAQKPSILYLNRIHGEEIQVEIHPVHLHAVWDSGRRGIYAMMDFTLELLAGRYTKDPRVLAVGPASEATDFGSIGSVPVSKGKPSFVDTWAGRGGFGTKMLQQHGIVAVIYGGTFLSDDFRDRSVADKWFEDKYNMKMAAKDLDATTKYRFEPHFKTGGTFGVNYTTLAGSMLSFNYRSIQMSEDERIALHDRFIINHYLRQFNEETISARHQRTCGEPCGAVCKKMQGEFKKDYEPYQVMGPLSGIFDQRAAERLNHHADTFGFDAISAGGVISWLMECLAEGHIKPEELGIKGCPVFSPKGFDVVADSMHNAEIGMAILDSIIAKRGIMNLEEGPRKLARKLAREKRKEVQDAFLYTSFARKGWMVPNQYWTPGVLSPMAIMGKYYMYYGSDFLPPRELGRRDASRMMKELILDNLGMCRFHRNWAEEMLPEIVERLYGARKGFLENIAITASRINSRNSSVYWESRRAVDFVHAFLQRKRTVENVKDEELDRWIAFFEKDRHEAGLSFWYEMHKGILESLKEF